MNPALTQADGPVLRDIHLPPPPGWWPPAPGWWIVGLLLIAGLVWALLRVGKRHAARRRQRAILHELDRCIGEVGGDATRLAASLSQFLRRMALRDSPAAAAFEGEHWLEYLDARGATDEFRRGVGRVLVDAPYRPQAEYDASALTALVRRWTRTVLASGDSHA